MGPFDLALLCAVLRPFYASHGCSEGKMDYPGVLSVPKNGTQEYYRLAPKGIEKALVTAPLGVFRGDFWSPGGPF